MKRKRISLLNGTAIGIAVCLTLSIATASGQHPTNPVSINAPLRTHSRMLYHNGPVRSEYLERLFYFAWLLDGTLPFCW